MKRRVFLRTAAAIPALAIMPSAVRAAAAGKAGDGWRTFETVTRVEIMKASGASRAWIPLPLAEQTDWHRPLGSWWSGNARTNVARDPKYGAEMLCAEWHAAEKAPVVEVTSRFATRARAVDPARRNPGAPRLSAEEIKLNTEGTELIPVDGIVRETARGIVKRERTDVGKARAIYEWIVENTFRDPKVRGCGWGDIRTMLETQNFGGKCGDLNAMFVGLARSVGVPARDVYGIRVAPSKLGYRSLGLSSDNASKGQHCRAEFYARGVGWVPVDPADVRKVVLEETPGKLALDHPKVVAARRRLFGSWEMNWLAYNTAHDVVLPGSSTKVPYLMYPNGETGGRSLDPLDPDAFRYTIIAREITS